MKTIYICQLIAVKEEVSNLNSEVRRRLFSDRWMQRLTEALDYISAYDCINGGFDDVDLDDIIFIETSVIDSISEIWKYEPIGYEWLIKYLKNELKLQEFSISAIIAVEKYWSDHPQFVDDLADLAVNNPFSSMRDFYEDSCDSINHLDSPRQAAMKVLVKHYPEHPKVLSLLKERSQKDSDENVRKWAYEQLQTKCT